MSVARAAETGGEFASAADIRARIERLPLSWWQIRTRIIVGTATFFDAFDALTIAYVLPVIVPLWKLNPGSIGTLISAGYLGQLIGALIGGALAERIGRRPVVVVSVLWFGLFSLACGSAWNYESLLVLRLLQGLGLGAEVPVAATYISELSKAKGRGRFVLLFEVVFPVGLLAAAVLGKWIVPNLGWQYLFYVGGIPALLALFMMRNLPESPRWLASRGRGTDAANAISFIEQRVIAATGKPLPEPRTAAMAPTPRPSWRDLFGGGYRRRTLVIWVAWFAAYFVNNGVVTWLPTVYQGTFHLPLDQALTYSLVAPSVGLTSSFICALAIDAVGRRLWFACGFAWGAAGCLLLWWIGPTTAERVLVLSSLGYVAMSTLSVSLYLYTAELYPTRVRALGTSAGTAWLRLASMIGPSVVGAAIGNGGGLGTVFLVFGCVALGASIVVALFAIETKSRVLEEVSP
jgi:MFS transporter, putative metabolite:H+ symporter